MTKEEAALVELIKIAINATDGYTNYLIGLRNGMRYIKSVIDGEEPQYEECAGQESCDDYISRRAVLDMCEKEIDYISKHWRNYNSPSEAKLGFAYISTNLYQLPSVQPKTKESEE